MIRPMLKVLLLVGVLMLPCFSQAAGLGELKVISALGQPLRAEIDLVSIKSGENQSLEARIAPIDAFRHSGVVFNPLLGNVKVSIATHPDGKPYIKVVSTEIVNDPFLDVLIQLSWSSGQLMREYTMLFDPVEFEKTPPAIAPPAIRQEKPLNPPVALPTRSEPGKYGPVRHGETLSGIAMATKPEGISLEQMLVALYRANAHAFDGKNMNRLDTGKILRIPGRQEIASIGQNEAARVVKVQAVDWNAYRQKLAAAAQTRGGKLKRSVSGKITASVKAEGASLAPQPQEVLKLSKGEASSATTREEDRAAQIKAMKDSSERVLMLEKNIQEMRKLLALKNKTLAEARGGASAPLAIAKPVAAQKAGASFIDDIMENPVLLGVAGGVILGLAGIGLLIARSRKGTRDVDLRAGPEDRRAESGLELEKPAQEAAEAQSEEPDPLEEARLYFSYRRYAQAEDILKEALQVDPANFEAYLLLMKIYAASKDSDALELAARRLQETAPPSEVWEKAMGIGFALDPKNPLYGGAVKDVDHEPAAIDLAEPSKDSLDFNLDFEMGADEPVDLELEQASTDHPAEETPLDMDLSSMVEEASGAEDETSIDFDLSSMVEEAPVEAGEAVPLDMDLSSMVEEASGAEDEAAVDFDLSSMVEGAPVDAGEAVPLDMDLSAMMEEASATEAETSVDFDLSSMLEETPVDAGEAAPVDMDLSSMVEGAPVAGDETAPLDFPVVMDETVEDVVPAELHEQTSSIAIETAGVDAVRPEGGPPQPGVSGSRFDISDIPSLAGTESRTRQPEMVIPDVDLNLGEEPKDASGPKDPLWYEVATKLDLAKVYQEMGDHEGAHEILEEVMNEGDADQKAMAKTMLDSIAKS